MNEIGKLIASPRPDDEITSDVINLYLDLTYNRSYGKVEVSKETIEGLYEAQNYVNELSELTKEEIEGRTRAYNETLNNSGESTPPSYKVEKVISEISDVYENFPIYENFAIGTESEEEAFYILQNLLCTLHELKSPITLPSLNPEEWHSQSLTSATNNLQRKIAAYEREVIDARLMNSAFDIIGELFSSST